MNNRNMLRGPLSNESEVTNQLRPQSSDNTSPINKHLIDVMMHTTQEWQDREGYVPPEDSMAIYTDYRVTSGGIDIPGIKIGDGATPIEGLPFITDWEDEKIEELEDYVRGLFLGETTTALYDGYASPSIVIDGEVVVAKNGNIVVYNRREFIWDESNGKWVELGIAVFVPGTGNNSAQQAGTGAVASGASSVAEGYKTIAMGDGAHAEGYGTEDDLTGVSGNNTTYTKSSHGLKIGNVLKYNDTYAYVTSVSNNGFTTNTTLSSSALNNATIKIVRGVAWGEVGHSEGGKTTATGSKSHAEGDETVAYGSASHAEGIGTIASDDGAHAEGAYTLASGRGSHAEGVEYNEIATSAEADAAHAEGAGVVVKGQAAHGEGLLNVAGRTQEAAVAALADFPNLSGTTEEKVSKLIGFASHSEGSSTQALGTSSHAEGNSTQALVNATHAEGDTTTASGEAAHSEGYNTIASGNQSHSEGFNTQATANQAHSEGKKTIASAENAHSEGNETKAVGNASHSEGYRTYAYGAMSHIEGTSSTLVSDANAASEDVEDIWKQNGRNFSLSRGQGSHVEGKNCLATGDWSHAEGVSSLTMENGSHAEGYNSIASGLYSHSEGFNCLTGGNNRINNQSCGTSSTNGSCAHAEGGGTIAQGAFSHAEGQQTFAKHFCSHAEGRGTQTGEEVVHVEGAYNIGLPNCIHEVGIGITSERRKNAHTITRDGKHYIPGVGGYVGTETDLTGKKDLAMVLSTVSLASDSGTSAITLNSGTKYKLSAGNGSVIFTMPSSGSSDIYWATYGTTTYDECKTAFDAGKVLVCKMADEYDEDEMMMVGTYKWDGGIFTFSSFNSVSKQLCYVTLDNSNWSTLEHISLEHTGNKVSSITSSNISSTMYYPSNGAITSYVDGAVAGRYQCTKKSSTGNISAVYCANGNIICVPTNTSTLTGTFVMTLDNFYSAFMKSIGGYTSIKGAKSAADKVIELSNVMVNSTIVKMYYGGTGDCTKYEFSYLSTTGSAGAPANFTYGASSSGCRIYVSNSSDVTITLV